MNVVHVPYKSVGQAITGLIGNQAQIMFGVSPAAVPQIKAGRLRGLAVSTRNRSAAVPDLPTMEEAGIADFDAARKFFPGVAASMANSSAVFLPQRPHYDLLRPGYALYGGNPTTGPDNPMVPELNRTNSEGHA